MSLGMFPGGAPFVAGVDAFARAVSGAMDVCGAGCPGDTSSLRRLGMR